MDPHDLSQFEKTIAKADEIAKAGKDQDGALVTLAKGVSAGMTDMLALLKAMVPGKGKPDDGKGGEGGGAAGGEGGEGGEEPEEPEEPEDPEDPEAEPGDGKPGFQDMRMGTPGGDEFVDATEYVLKLEKTVTAQGKEIKALRKAVTAGNAQAEATHALLSQFIRVYAANTEPMAKGVLVIQESLLDLPAAVHTPGLDNRRAAARHALDLAKAKDDTGIDVVKLTKGLKTRVLNENDLRLWKSTGRFRDDDTENAALVEKVKAL